jgi:hypothetical protein
MAAFINTQLNKFAPFLDKFFASGRGRAPGQLFNFEGSFCLMQNSVSLYIPVPPFGPPKRPKND